MKIFFSVGEPSGDVHGANLIRALREASPEIECAGFGGPQMVSAGLKQHFDLTSLAVMWVGEVLMNLRKFFRLADQAEEFFQKERPDAVVLVDYPGFNWHIAKRAKKYGIPVFYYSPPQIWGWKQGRVKKMRRLIDLVFSGLPFEAKWLSERGCRVKYVGHPFFDEVEKHPKNTEWLENLRKKSPVVGLLPGSRTGEVQRNLPVFLRVVKQIQEKMPNVHFAVAAFHEKHAEWIRDFLKKEVGPKNPERETPLNVEIFVQRTPEIIQAAECCLSVSGSVSLELLHHEKPTVIVYQTSRFGWWMQYLFRRVRFITLVNLLTVKEPFRSLNPEYRPGSEDARTAIFPEYLTCVDRSQWIAQDLLAWLQDETRRQTCVQRLKALRLEIAQPGAASNAAAEILNFLEKKLKKNQ